MSLIHIVKYDIKSALKSPWTYISFIFIIFLTSTFITSISQTNKIVEGAQILRLFSWTLSFLGILFLSKTVTRDFSQATIQKYLNDKINRIKYFFAKLLSITIIFLTFSIITLLLTVIFKNFIIIRRIIIKMRHRIIFKDRFRCVWSNNVVTTKVSTLTIASKAILFSLLFLFNIYSDFPFI